MLESEHIRALPADVKRKSLMVALDAAGVKVNEIVEDAVRRDRALDAYERVLQKSLEDLRAQTTAENQRIEEEISQRVTELPRQDRREQPEGPSGAGRLSRVAGPQTSGGRTIATAVSYFVSENPITRPVR